jgi:hypothetical protein
MFPAGSEFLATFLNVQRAGLVKSLLCELALTVDRAMTSLGSSEPSLSVVFYLFRNTETCRFRRYAAVILSVCTASHHLMQ